uniref:DNA (cytosine-5-)-methyltransferase n=1 Tax=viral metagenome TaxID=1070528 RepID=A0A6C0EV49_9ZZZZ
MNKVNYTVKELIQMCKDKNIKGYSGKKKEDILKLINFDKVENKIENEKFKFIDLFCGIGGFHQALKLNGTCVFACDIDAKCREIYKENYGLSPHDDITKVVIEDIPPFDILCAGFPCQSFSNSGKKGGFNDKRGMLFEYILKIAVHRNPKFMFLENVKHIKKIDNGKVFTHILKRINESGYTINESVFELSPHQMGVPQQRERVIFVCVRNDIYDESKTNKLISNINQKQNIKINLTDFFEKDVDQKYNISNELETVLKAWDEMIQVFEIGETISPTILINEFNTKYSVEEYKKLPKWKQDYIEKNKRIYEKYKSQWDKWLNKYSELLKKKEIYGKLEWQTGKKKENDSIFNYFIQPRQSGIRVKKAQYFPTLVAIVQTPIYAKEKRYITPRECARLQSFPDDFILHKKDNIAYKQLGNAVNVKVVHYVINETLNVYSGYLSF